MAEALVIAAEQGPRGRVADLGGPRRELLADLVREYLRESGQRKLVVKVRAPGAMGLAMRRGDLVPAADAAVGRQTFHEWLQARPPAD